MVLIKNMEMPKGCAHCCLKDVYYRECCLTHKKVAPWSATSRPATCPLVEVEETEDGAYLER